MGGVIKFVAGLLAVGLGACSLAATASFGVLFAPGSEGILFGAIFGLLDGCKFLLPTLAVISFSSSQRQLGVLCWVMYFFMAAVSMSSHVGLYNVLKAQGLGVSEAARTSYEGALGERDRLKGELTGLGKVRPVASVDAELTAKKLDPRYARSKSCTSVSVDDSRSLCSEIATLTAEKINAASADRIKGKLEEADTRVRGLNVAAVFVAADPQAAQLARLTGLSQDDVRLYSSIIISLMIEMGSSLMLTVAGGKKEQKPEGSHDNVMTSTDMPPVGNDNIITQQPDPVIELPAPAAPVVALIEKRRPADEDTVGSWARTGIIKRKGNKLACADAYKVYERHTHAAGGTPVSDNAFGRRMKALGYKGGKVQGRVHFDGIVLAPAKLKVVAVA